jgi:cysteine-S-conjugate beta-lyase
MLDLTLDELRRRRSAKWRFKDRDVLPLWVAEMDVRLAEPIRDALAELVERSDTGYVTWDGLPEAFAAFAARRWGQELNPGRMFVVPDVMRGIFGPTGGD